MLQSLRSVTALLSPGAILLFAACGIAQADDFDDASNAMCEHVKACAIKNMGEVPPEMMAMVQQSMGNMCQQVRTANPYTQNMRKGHPMYKHATACMRSMTKLSCEVILDGDPETPECEKAEKEAKKYE